MDHVEHVELWIYFVLHWAVSLTSWRQVMHNAVMGRPKALCKRRTIRTQEDVDQLIITLEKRYPHLSRVQILESALRFGLQAALSRPAEVILGIEPRPQGA